MNPENVTTVSTDPNTMVITWQVINDLQHCSWWAATLQISAQLNQTHLKQLIQVFITDFIWDEVCRTVAVQESSPKEKAILHVTLMQLLRLISFFKLVYIWKELERRHFNGPGFKYKIYWRQASGRSPHWNESSASNPPFIVNVNGTFIPFEIKVQAVNELGAGPEPDAEIGYSGEDCAFSNMSCFSFTLCFALS